jgi:hypothetical protein
MTIRGLVSGVIACLLAGCTTAPWGGVSSENQSGGVTAGSIGTVNNFGLPPDPRGLYQSGSLIGHVINARREGNAIYFQSANFSEYPDANIPIEFQNVILQCKAEDLPKPDPRVLAASMNLAVFGLSCQVASRK